ncbi:uncharacterized protein LOC135683790 [Rhopilema esculentum]|uniref:uncharacterized protein LOC135683790 n=1 Tax=Rhopilema esculentum TaxID=499914 RepID=UPI0031DA33E2
MAVKEGAGNINVNGITLTAYQQQQLHAHQMAILQKILDDQNVGLITNEERDASRPPSPTSPAAAASAPSFETNEDQLDELLINEVQLYRCLWDPRARAYKETPKKNEAWKQISTKLGKNDEALKKKWKYLRDGMMKCLKKIEIANRSGSGAHCTSTCKHFESLLFLKDSISNKATESNIVQPDHTIDNDTVSASLHVNSQQISLPPSPSPVGAPKRSRVDFERKLFEEARERRERMDILLLESIKSNTSKACDSDDSRDDADVLFCKSLVSSLKKMRPKQNRMAKIAIQQILLKYEFEEDIDN